MSELEHIDEWLVDYLDDELDQLRSEKVHRHLERCSRCRAQVNSLQKARALYRARSIDHELPAEAISEAIRHESRRAVSGMRKPKLRPWVLVAAAVAIVTSLMFVAVFDTRGPSEVVVPVASCEAHREAGARLARLGELDEALVAYERAIACEPESPSVARDRHARGDLFLRKGDSARAVQELQIVLGEHPDYAARGEVMLVAATIMEQRGETRAARAAYAQFIEEFPERAIQMEEKYDSLLTEGAVEQLRSLGYIR